MRLDALGRSTAIAIVVLGAGVALSGCSAGSSSDPAAPPSEEPATFVIDQDFPDPDVLAVDGGYIAYATNSPGLNVQSATSNDLETWTVSTDDMLPRLPAWATPGRTWAPDVSETPGGGYIMYVTAEDAATGKQCIGVATSATAAGPFEPQGTVPIVCPFDDGGAIDPATFTDADGARYLLWKNDGNCCGLDTWIQLSRLSDDGLSVVGEPTKLIKQTEPWEGALVEAPTLVEHDGTYVLLYSANNYGDDSYAIGVATAPTPAGPYTKEPAPLLSSGSSEGLYVGPGGQDVVSTPHGDELVFHSWDDNVVYRGMNVAALSWNGAIPSVEPPTR
ncbi:MAG: glycoside hydrolase family 43 protein [Leifsonia sp.]